MTSIGCSSILRPISRYQALRAGLDRLDAILYTHSHADHILALAPFVIGATTVWSAGAAFLEMAARGRASLGDLLLLFIYLEIGAMIGIYFKTTRLPVRYLIYIAITALGRVVIELVGAEHETGLDLFDRCGGNSAAVARRAGAAISGRAATHLKCPRAKRKSP